MHLTGFALYLALAFSTCLGVMLILCVIAAVIDHEENGVGKMGHACNCNGDMLCHDHWMENIGSKSILEAPELYTCRKCQNQCSERWNGICNDCNAQAYRDMGMHSTAAWCGTNEQRAIPAQREASGNADLDVYREKLRRQRQGGPIRSETAGKEDRIPGVDYEVDHFLGYHTQPSKFCRTCKEGTFRVYEVSRGALAL